VVTPQGNPGGTDWVDATTATGFTLNLAAPAPAAVAFGYHVVGLYPPAAAQAKVPSAGARPQVRRAH
jgi:hypothetical protein